MTSLRTLVSPIDGLPLSVLEMLPEQKPKGVIQLFHGMLEHKERYTDVMQLLCLEGFACVIHDHRGHGHSVLSTDDLGYPYTCDPASLSTDARAVCEDFMSRHPGLPLFVLGHSMGAMTALDFLRRYPDLPQGVILSGCPTDNPAKDAGILLCKILKLLRGSRHRSALMRHMTLGPFCRAFPREKSPMCWISSDPEQVRVQENNPLSAYSFSISGYLVLLGLMKNVFTARRWPRGHALPILFVSGEHDPCMGNLSKLKAAAKLIENAGFGAPDVRTYPGARHEVLFDPAGRDAACGDLCRFLSDCFSRLQRG